MNNLIEAAIKCLPKYKSLSPAVAKFFMDYFELWNQPGGCHEPNQYFAEREGVGIKTIEARFKKLRDLKVLKTTVNKFRDTYYTNQSGFITTRKNELDPVFKAQLEDVLKKIKEELARRRTMSVSFKRV